MNIILRIIGYLLFTAYLIVTLAFAAGVSEKSKNENGEFLSIINLDNFGLLYSLEWEITETIMLFLFTFFNSLVLYKFEKLRENNASFVIGLLSSVLPFIVFILKILFMTLQNIYSTNEMKSTIAFLRIFILYITFYFNLLGKFKLSNTLESKTKSIEKETNQVEIIDYINNHLYNDVFLQSDRENILTINFTDKKKDENNKLDFVILNNISPLKSSISPRRISIKNEVTNKLPLILVEKVKIPKFINYENLSEEKHDLNNSEETKIRNSFIDEISVIYQNDHLNSNERHSQMIAELNRIPDITFNVFNLSKLSQGNELVLMMSHLMYLYQFSETLKINKMNYLNFFNLVNRGYRKNSYHNSIHGCDVTQTLYFIIKTCNIDTICNLNDLEIFSCFFASAIHDLDHPGNNNNYEIAVGSNLAISYNDKAVLENYHLAKAFSLLKNKDCDVYENMSRTNYNISRAIIINMVLSTDMANHFLDLSALQNRSKSIDFDPERNDKQLLLNQLIHSCDISNPIKPLDIYKEWVGRVFDEFFNQGDKERDRGLKISYLCDRLTVNIIDSQIGFIDNIVYPLYNAMCLPFPNMKMIINLINNNKEEFKSMKEKGEKFLIE